MADTTLSHLWLRQTFYESGATSDSNDQYNGFDRFGRVINVLWETSADTDRERFTMGYDRDSNVMYRTEEVQGTHAFDELYHANGANGYDNLNQMQAFARGVLNAGNDSIASPTRSQSWDMDALGTFGSVTTDSVTVNRTHDQQNRLTELVAGRFDRPALARGVPPPGEEQAEH